MERRTGMSKLKTDEMRMNIKETFNITAKMLKVKGACASGMRDFLKEFPANSGPMAQIIKKS